MTEIEPLLLLSGVSHLGVEQPEWTLHHHEPSDRAHRTSIRFEQSFKRPPVVQVALTGFDASNATTLRLRVRAEDITTSGFDLVAETWLNSQVWSAEVSWLAIGA